MTTELQKIPYVNGVPGTGQRSIQWIINGDRLMGASEFNGSDGNLNLSTAQVQENVVVVDNNTKVLAEEVSQNNADIQNIYDVLNQGNDTNLIQRVSKNEENITLIDQRVSQEEILSKQHAQDITEIEESIGTRDTNDFSGKTILEDLFFIRKRIGNKVGETVNGDTDTSILTASGLFKNIDDVVAKVNTNTSDIDDIKQEISDANIPTISLSIAQVRLELGQTPPSNTPDVYTRLASMDQHNNEVDTKIINIQNQIGTGNVDQDIDKLQVDVGNLQTGLNSANERIATLNGDVNDPDTGIKKRVSDVESKTSNLTTVVLDSDTGLQKQVADVKTEIGDINTPNSINGKINALQGAMQTNSSTIQDIQITVGDSNSGLVQLTDYISKILVGLSPVINKGVVFANDATISSATLAAINDAAQNLAASCYSGIKSTGGISTMLTAINAVSSLVSTYSVIFVNCATYDYLFNTPLGTIADCDDSFSGTPTFYSEMYKLVKNIYSQPNGSKFKFIFGTGYPISEFTGSSVTWPATNEAGKNLKAYSDAVKEFCDTFGFACADTAGVLGLNKFTILRHFDTNGLLSTSPLCADLLRTYIYAG